MELSIVRPNVELSGQMEEKMFSIQDQGMIFEILRSKMYSNNILAICREISCNARDAHREVNKQDIPIEITLPHGLEPFYKVKDFGPGISPSRMENVFIKYTASTKRADNLQTGGFGLGAKTPFAYSDTFVIITCVDGIKYHYSCIIDETRVGKLILMDTEVTDEINGTEIIIPVKSSDFSLFRDWTEAATRHWSVRPTVNGDPSFQWFNYKEVIRGDNWVISEKKDHYNRAIKLIIDGIEYPLEVESLKEYPGKKIFNVLSGDLYIYFGVGELTLSANREQVYLDDKTKNKLREKLQIICDQLQANIITKINSYNNLWEANIFYRKDLQPIIYDLEALNKITWRGCPLHKYAINTGTTVYKFSIDKYKQLDGQRKIRRRSSDTITFEESSLLSINDLSIKDPTPRYVKKFFDDDPNLEIVQVICPNDKVSVQDLETKINLDKMEPKLLSSINKVVGKPYKAPSTRVLLFKFKLDGLSEFRQISYSDMEEDKNIKILVFLSKDYYGANPNSRTAILSSGKKVTAHALNSALSHFTGISIYGLDKDTPDSRIKEDFKDFLLFEEYIKEKIVSIATDFIKIKYALEHEHNIDDLLIQDLPLFRNKILDPNSLFLKKIEIHTNLKNAALRSNRGLPDLYEQIIGEIDNNQLENWLSANPDLNFQKINDEVNLKYPLLQYINRYRYERLVQPIAEYINLIDKV